MMFRAVILSLLSSVVSARILTLREDIPLDSDLGSKIMEQATVIEPARDLEQNRQSSFIARYSIKYLGCSSLIQVAQEGGGGGGGNNQNQGILYTQHLVRFALCPSDSCSSCAGGGEYVVNMLDFIDAYTEAKLTEQEYACENVRENCNCNYYNDDQVCANQCYMDAGLDECIQYDNQNNGNDWEIQRYLECAEMEGGNNNNNNNNNNGQNYYYNGNNGENYYGSYYVGPYCSANDGKSIYMGVFYDAGCTARADTSIFAKRNYMELPYSTQPIVSTNECMSCLKVENNGNNNNGNNNQNNQNYYYNNNGNNQNGNNQNNYYYQDMNPTELCEQSYERAARCEKNMDISYQDNTGCEYINKILPRLESATRSVGVYGGSSDRNAGVVFAWVFAFTTLLFGAYAYFLYRKIKRGAVQLADQ